ncbi:MAG: PhzF family isomerase [Ignavibacteria bacterium]
MKKTFKIFQADAFTKELFKGNPAGVVSNADGLTEKHMLSVAKELNNSETAFIFSPEDKDHEVRLRFFTPSVEVPSCGHATIAAHYVRAKENNLSSGTIYHKIGIGVLPVDIMKQDNDYKIMMTQGKPEFLEIIKDDNRNYLLNSLGLKEEDLYKKLPIQIISTGHSKVLIGIKSKQKLNSLTLNHNNLIQLSKKIGCNGYFVFTFESSDKEILTNGRMFAPAIGINEDPVTGNANGPLGAYLIKYNLVKHDGKFFSFKSLQGEAINREGICHVEVFIENGYPVKVKIGGYAVIAFKTAIDLNIN